MEKQVIRKRTSCKKHIHCAKLGYTYGEKQIARKCKHITLREVRFVHCAKLGYTLREVRLYTARTRLLRRKNKSHTQQQRTFVQNLQELFRLLALSSISANLKRKSDARYTQGQRGTNSEPGGGKVGYKPVN
jgi:hypothetical protein